MDIDNYEIELAKNPLMESTDSMEGRELIDGTLVSDIL